MDRKEFATFAMAMKTYYPKENVMPNQQAMELWFMELQKLSLNVAILALRKWVASNKWPPTIADINCKLKAINWEASDALRYHASYNNLKEDEAQQYRKICEETKNYKHGNFHEPTLYQALHSGQALMLGEGGDKW